VSQSGAVGIWHETYVLRPGNYEAVYVNMPPKGLAAFRAPTAARGIRSTNQGRLLVDAPEVKAQSDTNSDEPSVPRPSPAAPSVCTVIQPQ
jgi:hypothetical protein